MIWSRPLPTVPSSPFNFNNDLIVSMQKKEGDLKNVSRMKETCKKKIRVIFGSKKQNNYKIIINEEKDRKGQRNKMMELKSTNPTQGFESTTKLRQTGVHFPVQGWFW
jgi:hypothetical protein